ncbi:MAG: hypothetical protein ACI9EF_001177 [Pseudohongiellaceae bacterium]|jgi:hypothetical protein
MCWVRTRLWWRPRSRVTAPLLYGLRTAPAALPIWGIDHILGAGPVHFYSYETLDLGLSDHLAQLATFSVGALGVGLAEGESFCQLEAVACWMHHCVFEHGVDAVGHSPTGGVATVEHLIRDLGKGAPPPRENVL